MALDSIVCHCLSLLGLGIYLDRFESDENMRQWQIATRDNKSKFDMIHSDLSHCPAHTSRFRAAMISQ